MIHRLFPLLFALMGLVPKDALAHTSEQGFVLLLPTAAYTAAGVAAVVLTVLALFILPAHVIRGLFKARPLANRDLTHWMTATSLIALALLIFALCIGLVGPRNPLSNILPLGFWTLGWMAAVSLAGVVGNLWLWLNPWTGFYHLTGPPSPRLTLPKRLGLWPATLLMIGFAAFLLADVAPEDPGRLALFVATYWAVTFLALIIFGPAWMTQAELGQAIFSTYAQLASVRLHAKSGIGGPGWQLVNPEPLRASGIFALTLLAVGSFDGLNETYWWLGQIGVNPLEFPGRSAVIGATLVGLILSMISLTAIFALAVWFGLWISRTPVRFQQAFGALALSILPIALVYHVAHYLPSFLVSIQYTIAAISDPLNSGADLLRIQPFRVTTGFFNSIDTVRLIWLTQAGLVVLGHVWSILLSHRIALRLFGESRRASLATLPLSIFMIGYTFLGLWLLAAPRGA